MKTQSPWEPTLWSSTQPKTTLQLWDQLHVSKFHQDVWSKWERESQSDNESLTLHANFPLITPTMLRLLGDCRLLSFSLPQSGSHSKLPTAPRTHLALHFQSHVDPFSHIIVSIFLEFFASIFGLLSLFINVVAQVLIETSTSLILRNNAFLYEYTTFTTF